jgi:hypothetical protein
MGRKEPHLSFIHSFMASHTHTDTQTQTHADTHTHRHTHTQREREREGESLLPAGSLSRSQVGRQVGAPFTLPLRTALSR